jgi:uncharacterized RDD family membrane protein YckC
MVQETTPHKATKKNGAGKASPSLIEFPGVTVLPQWRKELGERVREVQERRARETTVGEEETSSLFSELEPKTPAPLELLPQVELPPVNPLVEAALRRIERAHSQPSGSTAVATAVAFAEQPAFGLELTEPENLMDTTPRPERVHNLAVVPAPDVPTAELLPENRKPRRIIDEQNDPALNYLDAIPTAVIERREFCSAPIALRILSAITDLAVVCLLSSPLLLLPELTSLQWQDPLALGIAAATLLVVSFLYLTISIAFTGRTIGAKLFSLRVVDARTGMIPTGSQSAGRALLYILSLASAGIALIYTFINSEKYTVHDRFTRTAVIRA